MGAKRELQPSPEQAAQYSELAGQHEYPFCWACGRDARLSSKPSSWHAPWLLHRAHIVSSPRIEAPWAVVLLCPLCHLAGHGERVRNPDPPHEYLPKITRGNLIWLKIRFDPGDYFPELLARCCLGQLPRAEPPDKFYTDQCCMRQPECVSLLELCWPQDS
jgi:hypothetical protein